MTEVENNDSNDKLKDTKPIANSKPKKSAKVVAKPKKTPITKAKPDSKAIEIPEQIAEIVDLDKTIILDLSNINKPKLTTPKKKTESKSKIPDILKDIPIDLNSVVIEERVPAEAIIAPVKEVPIQKPKKGKTAIKKPIPAPQKKVIESAPKIEEPKVEIPTIEEAPKKLVSEEKEVTVSSKKGKAKTVVPPKSKKKVPVRPNAKPDFAGVEAEITPTVVPEIEKPLIENKQPEAIEKTEEIKTTPEVIVKHQRSEVVQRALDSIGMKNDPSRQQVVEVEVEKESAPIVVPEEVENVEAQKVPNKNKPAKGQKKGKQPVKKSLKNSIEPLTESPIEKEEEEINYNLKSEEELRIEADKAKIAKVLEQIVLKKDNIIKMAAESEAIALGEVPQAPISEAPVAPESSAKKAKSKKRKKKTNAQKSLQAQLLAPEVGEQTDEISPEISLETPIKVKQPIKGKGQHPNNRNKQALPEKIANTEEQTEIPTEDVPKVKDIPKQKEHKKPVPAKTSEANSSKFIPNNMKVSNSNVSDKKPVHKEKPVIKKNILQPSAPVIIRKDETDLFEKQQITERVTEIIANISFPQLPPEMQMTTDQKLDLSIQKALAQVEKFLKNEIYVDNTATILVGVSGGVDSVSLLDLLALLSEKFYFKIIIAHYNHSLRGADSDADEDFVKDLAIKYGFDYFSAKGDVLTYSEKNSISIELAARQLRYNFFERTSRNHYADFVATAHTADDSAETFLFNLFRGSGLTGLSGIPATRNFVKNVVIARPLLTLKKKEIIEYAKARKLKWREDRTNEAVDYTRNRIRRVLIPLLEKEFNPQIIEAINRAAELIYGADQNINQQVQSAAQTVITDIRLERFSMKAQTLQTFDEFMQGEILQYALNKHLKIPSIPMLTIDSILNLIGKTSGKMVEFQQSYQAAYDRNLLIIGKLDKKVDESAEVMKDQSVTIDRYKIKLTSVNMNEVKYNPNPKIEFLDADQMPAKMTFRPWMQGDNFTPLGMNGTMKISDFLINEKIPSVDKPNIIVLANGDEVIWVCGYRINENCKISEKTKKAVKVEYYTL